MHYVCVFTEDNWEVNNREVKCYKSQKNSDLEEIIEPLFDDEIGVKFTILSAVMNIV